MNEKINPELELALDVASYKPLSSLYIGYEPIDDSWNLIIRYSGDISDLAQRILNKCIYLLGGFAIINIYTSDIGALIDDSRILYVDKADFYSYGEYDISYEKYSACITRAFENEYGLTGKGVYVGIIDSGLDIYNPEFRGENGLRIAKYWNQNAAYDSANGNIYETGRIYSRDELEEIVAKGMPLGGNLRHGTEVASVAAGSNIGISGSADIIVVEQSSEQNYPDTISIMMGIDFLVRYSIDNSVPLVINLSYGNNFGAHDGTSVLELFIDTVSQMAKVSIVTGTGNDGIRELHTSGILGNVSFADLDVAVGDGVDNFGIQIWKSYIDSFDVLVYTPSYNIAAYLTEGRIVKEKTALNTNVYGIFQSPSPYSSKQLVYIFLQSDGGVENGVWHIRLMPKSIVNGIYNAYLPNDSYVTGRVVFERSTANGSLTIPSTSQRIISVASYNHENNSLAGFSGRGYTTDNIVKPDVAAPGVGVIVSSGRGEYARLMELRYRLHL